MKNLTVMSLAGLACVVVLVAGIIAGIFVSAQLRSMSSNLDRMAVRVNALESMDRKLGVTNELLVKTNASLSKMSVASETANGKLGHMQSDLAVMSHKISGSFLFRGVK
jgi:uncharacterized protein YoxC